MFVNYWHTVNPILSGRRLKKSLQPHSEEDVPSNFFVSSTVWLFILVWFTILHTLFFEKHSSSCLQTSTWLSSRRPNARQPPTHALCLLNPLQGNPHEIRSHPTKKSVSHNFSVCQKSPSVQDHKHANPSWTLEHTRQDIIQFPFFCCHAFYNSLLGKIVSCTNSSCFFLNLHDTLS